MSAQQDSIHGGGTPSHTMRGGLHPPHTASAVDGSKYLQRTVKVPLEFVSDELWLSLRKLAFECSRYGNYQLNASYGKAKGWTVSSESASAYQELSGVLSSYVRDALTHGECVGIWRRLGKKILRGEQTLARFSADRALVCREKKGNGINVLRRDGGNFVIALTLQPKQYSRTELPVYMPALKRDTMLRELLDKFCAGELRVSKASIIFERPGRKIFCLLSYAKPKPEMVGGETAVLRWNESGELWLACNQRGLNLTEYFYRLWHKKIHFAGIQRRLRSCLGKSGKRRTLRRILLQQSYEEWADGPIKQLAAKIASWSREQDSGTILLTVPKDGEIPWARIISAIKNRCEADGLECAEQKPGEDLQKDWERIAGMLEAQRKLLSFGPPYQIAQPMQ